MLKKIFFLFLFFAPFTSFFAVSAWLRLPVVINQILFLLLVISFFQKGRLKTRWIVKEDILLLVFLALVFISLLLGFREKRSFNHTLAYTNAIIFYFFLSKYIIGLLKISSKEITKVLYYSFIVSSVIIISDFIGKNFYNFSLRDVFTQIDGKISNMSYFIRFGYQRVGGVAEEPGTMSLFYNIYFGLAWYYLYSTQQVKKYLWIIFLFIISHFCMLSNAGIVLPIIATIIIFLINKLKKMTITQNQIFWFLTISLFITITVIAVVYFNVGDSAYIAEEFLNKIFFNEEHKSYSSSGQRLKQWSRAVSNFIKHPILGYGPGYGVDEDKEGYLSVYLTIIADIGIIAFLFFISFQQVLIKKVMMLKVPIRSFLLFSVITSFLHLIIVSDFYHAPLWILFVIIQLIYKEQKTIKTW